MTLHIAFIGILYEIKYQYALLNNFLEGVHTPYGTATICGFVKIHMLYLVCSNTIVHEPCWIHAQSNYKEHTCVHLDQIHHFHTCYNFHISLKYISPTIFICFILANDYLGPAVDQYIYQYGMIN